MKLDFNNQNFKHYLDNINISITKIIKYENYFTLNDEKKISLQSVTSKIIKKIILSKISMANDEVKILLSELGKKNEELENFELAELYKNMITNFDIIFEKPKISTRKNKIIINDKNEDVA